MRAYWSALDRQSRLLAVSVAISVLLHAILLTIHFRFPEAMRWTSSTQPLEVVLVNAKTRERPATISEVLSADIKRMNPETG